MNKLILLGSGSKRMSTPPGEGGEPYRVIWNFSVASADKDQYLLPGSISAFGSQVLSLEPLTDHAPLSYRPSLHFATDTPLDNAERGSYAALVKRPPVISPMGRVGRIEDIAFPDRRGRLPKVFQIRGGFGPLGNLSDMDIIRYNLDESGGRFIALRSRTDQTTSEVFLSIVMKLDLTPDPPHTTSEYELGVLEPDQATDDLRLIIFDDRVEAHVGQPGTSILTLPLYAVPTLGLRPNLNILSELGTSGVPTYLFVDGLIIYDGYY